MPDDLEQAASEVISAMNMGMGLQALLQVPTLLEMYGRLGGADFHHAAISVLQRLIEVAKGQGLTPIVEEHTVRLVFVQSMLEKELARMPIPTTPLDAEPTMRHDRETGQSYIVVGGGPCNGGYFVKIN